MILTVKRTFKCNTYTIGAMYIDNKYFCDTLEDKDRGLVLSMSENEIKRIKVMHETAIPTGRYLIDMNTISPKFSKMDYYKKICDGKVPRLVNVKGFDGILIHIADGYKGAELISGCIAIGRNTIKGGLTEGKKYFELLYNTLLEHHNNNEKITIEIIG